MNQTREPSALEAVLRRDRVVVTAGLIALAAIAWAYLVYLAGDMGAMMIPRDESWRAGDFSFQFGMWAVMMVAMMTPSAAPMILVFATVQRQRREQQKPFVPASVFVAGYLLAWAGFAAAATSAQWALHSAALLSPMMESTSAVLGGSLLLLAALYQVTPLKYACLTTCQSPLSFIMGEWRDGTAGALRMGAKHGAYCVGCCWVLMALLFVTGVMSLVWVAVIAGFVLIEKLARSGRAVTFVSVPVLLVLSGLTVVGVIT